MLNWAKRFNIFCYLDNQQYSNEGYECLLAVNAIGFIDDTSSFNEVDDFLSDPSWCFGHLSYSLKDQLLQSPVIKKDRIGFPQFYFFQPEFLFLLKKDELIIQAKNADDIYNEVLSEELVIEEENNSIVLK